MADGNFNISISGSSYTVRVGPGLLFTTTGSPIEYPGGSVTMPANATRFVYFDTASMQPVLSAAFDESVGVFLGRVVSGSVGCVSVSRAPFVTNTIVGNPNQIEEAGDLQDLASFGIFDLAVANRVRVLRDNDGNILGSGRWYSKITSDTRPSDGITIILPIDVSSDTSPGRWVLEGYEP
jgi:hypothetical protein